MFPPRLFGPQVHVYAESRRFFSPRERVFWLAVPGAQNRLENGSVIGGLGQMLTFAVYLYFTWEA